MILSSTMLLPPVAFVRRVVHRTTVALRLWLTTLMLATLLAIHGRTAEAFAAMSRSLIRSAVAGIGRIHGSEAAALRRIHRSTLPIALGLGVTLKLNAITRTGPIRAALCFTQSVRAWAIPFALFSRTWHIAWWRSRWSIHFGRSGRRLVCGLGFLGLQ